MKTLRQISIAVIMMTMLVNCSNSQNEKPVVYMTTDISPEGLVKVYEALGVKPEGKVAVKISTGEPGGKNFLKPELIKDLVQKVNGTIVECNTAYAGKRNTRDRRHHRA